MKKPFTVGIAGGSGSGKTHFLKRLASQFDPPEICLLSMDHYYKPIDQQQRDENGVVNFDLPDSIDKESFVRDIRKLKQGEVVLKEEYTFNNPQVKPKQLQFQPAPILIVEGLFVQYFEEVARELDLKLFIEAEDHLKLSRRIARDQAERGYDLEDVLYQYEHHTKPVYEQQIEPLKNMADLIIPNNENFGVAVDMVAAYLRTKETNRI